MAITNSTNDRPSRRRLTDEEHTEALRLVTEGTSVADICRRFGISRNGMCGLIARAGVMRICTRCKINPVERKRRFCEECSLGQPIQRARTWRRKRLDTGMCPSCPNGVPSEGYSTCDKCRQKASANHNKLKRTVIAGYGGCCRCCGESVEFFLTVDHVNDDGKHQRTHGDHGTTGKLYRKLIREGFPDYCCCLCFNCNHGRYLNGGICPHKSVTQLPL